MEEHPTPEFLRTYASMFTNSYDKKVVEAAADKIEKLEAKLKELEDKIESV